MSVSALRKQRSGRWGELDGDPSQLHEQVPPSQELHAVALVLHFAHNDRSAHHGYSWVHPSACYPVRRQDVIPGHYEITPGESAHGHQRLLSHGVNAVCANGCSKETYYLPYLADHPKGIRHRGDSRVRMTCKTPSTACVKKRHAQHHVHHVAENHRGHHAHGPHVPSRDLSRPEPSPDAQSPVALSGFGRCHCRAAYEGEG